MTEQNEPTVEAVITSLADAFFVIKSEIFFGEGMHKKPKEIELLRLINLMEHVQSLDEQEEWQPTHLYIWFSDRTLYRAFKLHEEPPSVASAYTKREYLKSELLNSRDLEAKSDALSFLKKHFVKVSECAYELGPAFQNFPMVVREEKL